VALWSAEVVWGLDALATLYATTAEGAQDEAHRWMLEHCDEDVPPAMVRASVPVAVARCEDCGDMLTARALTIVAEGGHGQGVDGHPLMLMCVQCHMEAHTVAGTNIVRADMVGDICDACFPETAALERIRREQADWARERDSRDWAAAEHTHHQVFGGTCRCGLCVPVLRVLPGGLSDAADVPEASE
jgi:hypothetical protein